MRATGAAEPEVAIQTCSDRCGGYSATKELAEGNPDCRLFDARVSYEAENFSVSVWGKNLTDEFYCVYGLNISAIGTDYFTRGLPRTYGLELKYNF